MLREVARRQGEGFSLLQLAEGSNRIRSATAPRRLWLPMRFARLCSYFILHSAASHGRARESPIMAEAESVEIRVMSVQLQDVPFKSSGQCKFGITCKFHSPLYAGSPMSASAPQFFQPVQSSKVTPVPEQYGGAATGFRVARTIFPGSYVPKANGHMLISPWTCFND